MTTFLDPERMSVQELKYNIQRMRAPASGSKQIVSTSRGTAWCRRSADGFTPVRALPAVRVVQSYDTATYIPHTRVWEFYDAFNLTRDRVTETITIKWPCSDAVLVARDIQLCWQMRDSKLVNADRIPGIEQLLFANTACTVPVKGCTARCYRDLWPLMKTTSVVRAVAGGLQLGKN